jgi:hypothetical protein
VFRKHISATENATNRTHGGTVHSRFAGPELDLICNHNFV